MRRSRIKTRRGDRNRIGRAARGMRVTNEEILGDLLYPAPASRIGERKAKAGR